MKRTVYILLSILFLTFSIIAQQKDNPDCKDHPLFTRMRDSWIHHCAQKEFDAYAFTIGKGKTEQVEGQYWKVAYYPQAALKSKPSELQILRNFENAVTKLGGTVLYSEKTKETLRLTKDGKDLWVEVTAEFTGKYGLVIVEKKAMAQDIVANADVLLNDLKTTGHSAMYGIYFDTGKSEVRPESELALKEIAKMLKQNATMKFFVVGHTDNVGEIGGNMALSKARAESVVKELTTKHGVDAGQLAAHGIGSLSPVAPNTTEEGRALNRRVELVAQ